MPACRFIANPHHGDTGCGNADAVVTPETSDSCQSVPLTAPSRILDLKGLKCPLPALKTAKVLKGLAAGESLTVLCTDPMAVIDIPALLNETGDRLLAQEREGEMIVFQILRS